MLSWRNLVESYFFLLLYTFIGWTIQLTVIIISRMLPQNTIAITFDRKILHSKLVNVWYIICLRSTVVKCYHVRGVAGSNFQARSYKLCPVKSPVVLTKPESSVNLTKSLLLIGVLIYYPYWGIVSLSQGYTFIHTQSHPRSPYDTLQSIKRVRRMKLNNEYILNYSIPRGWVNLWNA